MTYLRDAGLATSPPNPKPAPSPVATYGKPSWPYGGYRVDDAGDEWHVMRYLPVVKKWELHLRYPKAQYRVEDDVDAFRVFRGATTKPQPAQTDPIMDAAALRIANRARNIILADRLRARNVAARERWAERTKRGCY